MNNSHNLNVKKSFEETWIKYLKEYRDFGIRYTQSFFIEKMLETKEILINKIKEKEHTRLKFATYKCIFLQK